MKKTMKIIIAAIAIVALCGTIAGVYGYKTFSPPKFPETEEITLLDKEKLRVGILSDTQLPGSAEEEAENGGVYRANLKDTLELFKEQDVDMIIHAGDFCEVAGSYAYQTYNAVFSEVYPHEAERPILQYVMGNHDFWTEGSHRYPGYKQNLFAKNMDVSPWTHKIINGIHFIAASPDSGDSSRAYTGRAWNWLDEQLQLAEKDAASAGMPIFVITHQNPSATVYGSGEWGDQELKRLLDKYPQAVSISGHSHFSILDERSIYQDKFTAFTTQSVAYIEMEGDKFDPFRTYDQGTNRFVTTKGFISCPPNDKHVPMCLIMNVGQETTEIERWNVTLKKEEKADRRWTLRYPLGLDNFSYRANDQVIGRSAPVFPQGAEIKYLNEISNWKENAVPAVLPGITFPAAQHSDFVHSYYLRLINELTGRAYEYTYYSDFYAGTDEMAKTVTMALDPSVPSGRYRVQVYAIESFGQLSQPLETEIEYIQPILPPAQAK